MDFFGTYICPIIDYVGEHILPITGTIIVLAIGAYFAGITGRQSRFACACRDFKTVFLSTEDLFSNQDISDGLYEHILTEFSPHKRAVLAFYRSLGPWRRRGFRKAWNNYRYGINKAYPPPYKEMGFDPLVQYYEGLTWGDVEETKQLVLKRIHKILSYANAK